MPKIRLPTDEDYQSYDGAHCRNLWKKVDDSWRCPGCGRAKREIMRWTRRKPKPQSGIHEPDWGWMAGLHARRDHTGEQSSGIGRFHETIICDHCTSAATSAKKRLGLPKEFSFAPCEIRSFVTATPHGPHKIDLDRAREEYRLYVEKRAIMDRESEPEVPPRRVPCEITETELEGYYGQSREAVCAACRRCGHETESFGVSEASIRRCLALMGEECPRDETNFYYNEDEL